MRRACARLTVVDFKEYALSQLAPPPGRVLEVGCGDGRLTRRYARRAGSVHAIDPDPSRIAALEADRPEGHVTAQPAGFLDDDLDLPEPVFDAIIFSWSL